MRIPASRTVCSILLLLAASGLLLWGLFFHVTEVCEEKEREITIAIPLPFGFGEDSSPQPGDVDAEPPAQEPDGHDKEKPGEEKPDEVDPFRSPPTDGARCEKAENPFEPPADESGPPLPLAGVRFQNITEKYLVALEEPEWVIVREVTFGGLTRLANGQLKRTYSGQPRALCPT